MLACAILLTACGTMKKQTRENVVLETVENVDKSVKETGSQSSHTDAVKEVKTNVTDRTVTRTTETEYSALDASGKQHKTKEKTTETLNDIAVLNEQNERIISEQSKIIERQGSYISALETRLSMALSENTKTTTRTPFWAYILAFSIGVAGAIMLQKWLKKIFKP